MFRCCQSRFPQGRAWLGALTAMTASLALFGAGSASAADVLDAHCGDPTNPGGSSFNSFPRVGQTFTALNTGQLISATVNVNKVGQPPPSQPDAAFSMQIRPLVSGAPEESAASAIATESVQAPALTGFQPLTANFSSPASVVAGQQYALVVERTDRYSSFLVWGQQSRFRPVPVRHVALTARTPARVWGLGPRQPTWHFAIHVNAVEPPPTVTAASTTHSPTRRRHRPTRRGAEEVQEEVPRQSEGQEAQEVQEEGKPPAGLAAVRCARNSRFGRKQHLWARYCGAMSQENVEIALPAVDAWNRGDREAWLALWDEEAEFSPLRAQLEGESYRGHDGLSDFWPR